MEQPTPGERIEQVRAYVDQALFSMTDPAERRCAYVHLYGVAQGCAMIAQKRKEDVELAVIAGMLHDLAAYQTMDRRDHAHRGAAAARNILDGLRLFGPTETDRICQAIYDHSDKAETHAPLTEVLIDADVLQHGFYNPFLPVSASEKKRLENLKSEFGW